MITDNMPSTSKPLEAKTSGFSSVGDVLGAAATENKPPVCPACKGSGLGKGSFLVFSRWGEIHIATNKEDDGGTVCDCPAGDRVRVRQAEALVQADRKREEYFANKVTVYRSQANIPSRMADWRLESYPGDPKLVLLGRQFVDNNGYLDDGPKEKIGLLLLGKSGVGKTGLAVAILNTWIDTAQHGLFWETGSFLRAIRATFSGKSERTTEDVTRPAKDALLFVLDDIGDVGRGGNALSDFTREEIFDLVNFRYNQEKPTILTSNLTVKQMVEQFGERTWWRIADMCMVVEVGGKNLRA